MTGKYNLYYHVISNITNNLTVKNMQTTVLGSQVFTFPDGRLNYRYPINKERRERNKRGKENLSSLTKSLSEKGLDRLTLSKIEHVICTSALSAHI